MAMSTENELESLESLLKIFGDKSILKISLSLHVYSKTAYNTAMGKFTRCSAAESAMHHEGKVYGDETAASHKSLLALNRQFKQKAAEEAIVETSNPIKRSLKVITDISEDKPWYRMNQEALDGLLDAGKATRVPVLGHHLMDSRNRYVSMPIHLDAMKDKEFTQVGLILQLSKPNGMQYDHWDRVGSVGLEFPKTTASAHVHKKSENAPKPLDPALVDSNYDGANSLTAVSGLLMALLAYLA